MLKGVIKRVTALVFAVLMFSFAAEAAEITENPGKEFFVYGESEANAKIAAILGETEDALDKYCEDNGIIYLAVNEKNTKQIRLSENSTAFSQSVGELSNLSDDKIAALAPEIAGTGFHTETAESGGKKFIKATAASSDSGGSFTLIQYITVTEKKEYTLSFYTASGDSTNYAKKLFDSLSFGEIGAEQNAKKPYGYIFLALAVIFVLFGAYIVYTLIRDIKAEHTKDTEEENDSNA